MEGYLFLSKALLGWNVKSALYIRFHPRAPKFSVPSTHCRTFSCSWPMRDARIPCEFSVSVGYTWVNLCYTCPLSLTQNSVASSKSMTNFNASSHKDLLVIKLQNPIIGNRLVIPDLTKRAVLSASYLKTTFYYSPCLAMGSVRRTFRILLDSFPTVCNKE